jgi:hypothetical protein
MKTWKTIGVAGLLLTGLLMSGTAQAGFWDRPDHRPGYYHKNECPRNVRFERHERNERRHEFQMAQREHDRYLRTKERRHAWFH